MRIKFIRIIKFIVQNNFMYEKTIIKITFHEIFSFFNKKSLNATIFTEKYNQNATFNL